MTLNELYSRVCKLTALALVITELDEKKALSHTPNLTPAPTVEIVTELAGLLAADMAVLYIEAEETSTRYMDALSEAQAAAEALLNAADWLSSSDPRSVERFFALSFITARTFAAARDKLAQDEGIFAATKV